MNINIVKPFMPGLDEIADDFAKCLSSGLVTNNSPHVRMFEDKLQEFYGCPIKPSLNCNGELALYHLIQAWKHKMSVGPHESFEVLVPSFTFSGTINAVVTNNLKPVFCDVDETMVLDIEKALVDSPDVRMILPVGAYGNIVNLERLQQISREKKLAVVLDNAPAFGTKFKGRHSWEYGFSEMISFHATKIFNSMEGGCNIVNDPEIDELLRRLRDFGQYEKVRGDVDVPGLNSKMTEVCALVGLRNLAKADFIIQSRTKNAARYVEFFGGLESQGLLRTMKVLPEVDCPYLYFPIILNEEATEFVNYMQGKGVAVRRYYTANHSLKFYSDRYREQDLSFTNAIKDNLVSLPLHTVMSDEELDYLFSTVRGWFEQR
ncbi:DegT/DnrJ/EryC1/StrS family aminotransferase [Brevifollis gellanilyticus]|uniref:Aminotransferase DegT n=1 Tax=Brevifollis gellanilyticus TaxID=748831 RepID=A0A512M9X0_9BACT|nr:DegT/DnrJ/EryC1/StrS family aminotransferase [Brevifollis gellanilyticus]GEP43537.1 aminotransferase DegT [Brevifollis gellanilyticus]